MINDMAASLQRDQSACRKTGDEESLCDLIYHSYISLGDNCEAGLQFQRIGYEESSFFRYLYAPFESVVQVLANDFADVFLRQNLVPSPGGMALDTRYDIKYHSKLKSAIDPVTGNTYFIENEEFDRTYRDEFNKVQYLVRKWRILAQSQQKVLYIIKRDSGFQKETVQYLLQLFHEHYPEHRFTLLFLQTENFRAPDWELAGCVAAYFPRFAPVANAYDADAAVWDALFAAYPLATPGPHAELSLPVASESGLLRSQVVAEEMVTLVAQLAVFFSSSHLVQLDWSRRGSVDVRQFFDGAGFNWPLENAAEEGTARLPLADASCDTVFDLGSLGQVADAELDGWLSEVFRVAGRNVWIVLEATSHRDQHWWTAKFREFGFQSHPLAASIAPVSEETGGNPVVLILEKPLRTGLALPTSPGIDDGACQISGVRSRQVGGA